MGVMLILKCIFYATYSGLSQWLYGRGNYYKLLLFKISAGVLHDLVVMYAWKTFISGIFLKFLTIILGQSEKLWDEGFLM